MSTYVTSGRIGNWSTDAMRTPGQSLPIFDVRQIQILKALKTAIARFGVGKTSVDDVAKLAGLSRSTLYRYFPEGKDEMLKALLLKEVFELKQRLYESALRANSLDEAILIVTAQAFELLSTNPALEFVLKHEPEAVVSHMSFDNAGKLYSEVGNWGIDFFGRFLDSSNATRVMEWLARIILSYYIAPNQDFDVLCLSDVKKMVESFVLPGLKSLLAERNREKEVVNGA